MNHSYGRCFSAYLTIALLLYGCASVDSSRDKGSDPARTSSSPIPSRPILCFGIENRELVIRGFHPDGRTLGTLASGQLAGWSRKGDLFAYLTEDKASKEAVVSVMELGGQPRTIFKASSNERVFLEGWQSIWSPDGKRIALLVARAPDAYSLAIVEIEKNEVDQRFELPKSAYTRGGGPMNWPPYNLKWSPDGRKVLIAWEHTVVLDVASGAVETIAAMPAMAEWMPGSDGVYYFDKWFSVGNLVLKKLGRNEVVKVLDRAHLGRSGMVELVLFHTPILKLSPSGTRLAMQAGNTVLVFNVEPARAGALTNPTRRDLEGPIVALEWGPDEKTLAVLGGLKERLALGALDLETGKWRTLEEQVVEPGGTPLDLLGLVNTISWVP